MGQFGGAEGRRGGAHKRSTVALNHLKILNEGCVADTPAGSLLGCGKEVIVLIRGWIAWATQRKGGRQKIGRDERNCPKKQHFLWRTLSPRSIGTAANCSSYFKWLYIKDLLTLTVRRSTKVTYMYCTIRGKLGGGGVNKVFLSGTARLLCPGWLCTYVKQWLKERMVSVCSAHLPSEPLTQ